MPAKDAAGNVSQLTNPDVYTLTFDCDPNNHVIRAADQQGNAVLRILDLDGKPRGEGSGSPSDLSREDLLAWKERRPGG